MSALEQLKCRYTRIFTAFVGYWWYNTSVKYYSQSNKKGQLSGDPELL